MNHLANALYLSLPLVISGALHMLMVRFNSMPHLNRPLSERLFGRNKTWRGIIVIPLMTVVGVVLTIALELKLDWQPYVSYADYVQGEGSRAMILGALLGLGYALAELPNSWVKRRLGIAPGTRPERHRPLFTFVDQADSAVGCMIVLLLLMPVPAMTLLILFALSPAIHLVMNLALYSAGMRKEPF